MDLTESPRKTSLAQAKRRRAIADLYASGALYRHSLREIAEALKDRGIVNPAKYRKDGALKLNKAGEPVDPAWSHEVIRTDITWLKKEWHKLAIRAVSEQKAEILAKYDHLWRQAITDGNLSEARHILKGQRELLGTDAPTVIVYEQVQARMEEAYTSLKEEFGAEPELWTRIVRTLLGRSDPTGPGGEPSSLPN